MKDKSQTGGHKLCRQRLYVDGVLVARCQVPWGVNHSHPSGSGGSAKAITKMVELGEARYVRHSTQGHPGHSVKV